MSTSTPWLCALLVGLACVPSYGQRTPAVPAWRGKSPGAAFLGPDILWRPRERMLFLMQDDRGSGFTLTLTARDMNTYLQGARPVMVWVTGPNGETIARTGLSDDGIVSGNDRYKDGIYDPWMDFRYREWHRVHSPNGIPLGKARSPFLAHPEQLPARELTIPVPAAGKGLYRVMVIASWDHWISLTPSRPLPAGVHPGPGPLYVHGNRLKETYLYTPTNVKDLAFAVSEEIQPYNWSLAVEEVQNATAGAAPAAVVTTPRTFMNSCLVRQAKPNAVYRLRLTGSTTGACLHLSGAPMVLCPDAATARLLHGGVETDARGRVTCLPQVRTLLAWADHLKPEEVQVNLTAKDVPQKYAYLLPVFDKQDVNPASAHYGEFLKVSGEPFTAWDPVRNHLARAVADQTPGNGFAGHPAVIRRVLLACLPDLARLTNYYCFTGEDPWQAPAEIKPNQFWGVVPLRSPHFGLGIADDLAHINAAAPMRDLLERALPATVIRAWKTSCDDWVLGRTYMHDGETSNQWCLNLLGMLEVLHFTGNPVVKEILDQQLGALLTPGADGRMNPDKVISELGSSVGMTGDADTGLLGCGALADDLGYDAEYCNESLGYLNQLWQETHDPRIAAYMDGYSTLKAYLALPGAGNPAIDPLVCPTDMSHRTPYASARIFIPPDAVALAPGARLWDANLPCLRTDPFTRVIDNQFYFINTAGYYAVAYTGGTSLPSMEFGFTEVQDGAVRCVGYSSVGYGGVGYKATKLGGISAIYVRNCGPTLLCNNADVMYTNAVWGRRKTPICAQWEDGAVDPYVICSGYANPIATFDATGRVLRTSGTIEYAPLAFTRTVHFRDDRVVVTLELTALDDLDLTELHEAIPFYATGRVVKPFDDGFREGQPLNVSAIPAGTALPLQALDIAAQNGAGTAVLFDRLQSCTPAAKPWELSRNGGQVSSISVPLAAHMRAGQIQRLRYVLLTHQQAITAEELRKVAGESFLAQE